MEGETPRLLPLAQPQAPSHAAPRDLQGDVRAMAESPIVRALLRAFDGGVLVLNAHRQIVAANLGSLVDLPERDLRRVLGLRPGEALGCAHAREHRGGCGAAEACRGCGALQTVLGCQLERAPVDGECVITVGDLLRPLELRLRATPLELEGRRFTVLALRDVSDSRRRRVLERVFLHDLLNALTPLSNWAHLLRSGSEKPLEDAGARVAELIGRVTDEVHAHRALLEAEHGNLKPTLSRVRSDEVVRAATDGLAGHPACRDRQVRVGDSGVFEIDTDRALLLRVLTNMLTNALEATAPGGVVSVWCAGGEPNTPWAASFHVHNDAVIPKAVALHVFQRSFSTKSRTGRGLGTYSMKLLGERYLGGEVSFASAEGEGTTFSLRVPRRPDAKGRPALRVSEPRSK